MKNIQPIIVGVISYFFILLFIYASASKMLDFENFQVQLAQSPLLSAYAGFISYAVIIIEVMIAGVLADPKVRRIGLYASFGLMVAFTVYIFLILNYSDFIPCSCGGILEKMSWDEHLIFNVVCVVLALTTSVFMGKERAHGWSRIAAAALIAVFSAGSMVALFLSSEHIIKKENNFTRRFVPHPISNEKALNLEASSFYFAGNNGDSIFLGNRNAPLLMATISPKFSSVSIDTLKLSEYNHPFKNVELNIVYPYFSVSDGTVPILFEGQLPTMSAKKTDINNLYFLKLKMYAQHQYIFKAVLLKNKKSVMGSFNSEHRKIEIHDDILKQQMDGLFDTDGDFSIDVLTKKMVYTYFYRNQYIITDLNLRIESTGNTIDTISKAQIKLHTTSDLKTKMVAPPLEVNEFQYAYANHLFNASKLRGKYESLSRWNKAKVIDVYDYQNKSYQYSFYIYHRGDEKVRSILITKKYLYALIGNEIIKYQRRR